MRVHEFAKELGTVKSSEILEILKKNGIAKTNVSSITDEEKQIVRNAMKSSSSLAASSQEVKPNAAKQAENKQATKANNQKQEAKKPENKTVSTSDSDKKPIGNKNEQATSAQDDKKPHITQVYNPQNSGNGYKKNSRDDRNHGNNRNFNRDNHDNRNQNGDRNQNNRGFNRDNRNQNGDNRNFNRDNRDNRDNRNQNGDRNQNSQNNRGFNRDNRNQNGDNRNFNRDNRGYNKDGGYNKDSYNKDGDNRKDNRGQRNNSSRNDMRSDVRIETKPENRRALGNNKDKERNKDYQAKENLKFMKNNVNKKPAPKKEEKEEDTIKTLVLPDELTLKELADKMKVQPSVVVKKLFLKGQQITINQDITFEQAEEIALEFNCICEHEKKVDVIAELLKDIEDPEESLKMRPPVVCVMGHVDHGKTSLLDAIRSTNVTSRESGGITQHIGAYVTQINDSKITFLDTPGHEAFTAMRMRGAQSTDIAVLVVAADDGVMPQTIEAINHAKAAGVEIIVAVNKIDKPSANIERVKQELTEYGLVASDWGGQTEFVPVSAKTHEGIDSLLEMITLTAEILELKANPNRKARGLVIEAQLDKGRGPVATILVQKGTLHVGDTIAAGSCYGKIRAMMDDKGRRVKEALPSTPVEILGLNDVPNAGEIIVATDNDKEARNFAETFIREGRVKMLNDTKAKLSLDDLFSQIKAGNVKELNIVVKADVQGSVEAVKSSLVKLSNEEVVVKVIHGGVGNINESDVILASASNAIIIGFNVRPDNQAREIADKEKVDLRLYKVIYNAIEDVEAAMKGMLDPIFEEKITGHLEIRQVYKASAIGNIAGSYVTDGLIRKNSKVRIKRDGEQIFDGELASLKRFKDDVKEVKEGFECGLVFEGFGDIQELDVVEAYEMVEVPR